MQKAPHMLLIGAAGRNTGKTEFACTLIRRFSPAQPITAVKITVIRSDESRGSCPRGGSGCGVCSSLEGEYDITEETNRDGEKDTSRLLRAGANRVFWLRVLDTHMAEGMAALGGHIDPHSPVICESNSIRKAVRPGLFFMVKDKRSAEFKPTARAVADLADRTVLSDGERFDLDPDTISLRNGRWYLREPATAIIMAGGGSTRMGQDKSLLQIEGKPMIQHVCDQLRDHFDEIVVSANDPSKYAFLGLRVVPDRKPDMGPMMGLASTLATTSHELALAVACDIPRIDLNLAHRMLNLASGHDAVAPRVTLADGTHLEPLFAVYRKSTAARMFELLEQGERRIRHLLDTSHVRFIDVEADATPKNLNTEEDYRAYIARTDAGF
ncbi:MAG: molybdenum cofactor guanylyltransferase [Verrucomicrobiota bacterium]